jgi:hypothetical protein
MSRRASAHDGELVTGPGEHLRGQQESQAPAPMARWRPPSSVINSALGFGEHHIADVVGWRVEMVSQSRRSLAIALSVAAGLILPMLGSGLLMPDWIGGPARPRAAMAWTNPHAPNFEPVGTLSSDGLTVGVSGPFACTPDDGSWRIQVNLTQESTKTEAHGVTQGVCRGELSTWAADAMQQEDSPTFGLAFSEGTALACGFGETFQGTTITGNHFWCQYIMLQMDRSS